MDEKAPERKMAAWLRKYDALPSEKLSGAQRRKALRYVNVRWQPHARVIRGKRDAA